MRSVLRSLAPGWLRARYRRARLAREARRLSRSAPAGDGPDRWWDAVSRSPLFAPLQQRSEILGLLAFAAKRHEPLRAVCEVGVAAGGTSFLLARAADDNAILVLVDRQFTNGRDHALQHFARGHQRIVCVSGDSQAETTAATVRRALAGQPLDLLLIDADHALAGVARDFALYAPLVRPGGLVAFHDIVADHRQRFGADTSGDAGDVAEFWRGLGERYGLKDEFVDDPAQDGGGIGLLVWRP